MAEIVVADKSAMARAAAALREGRLVAFPTETVYGLGGDATSDAAVAAIFKAKGRPGFNPLIVHVADLAAAQKLGHFNEVALQLAANHWPGPMTLVVPRRADAGISPLVTAGLSSIAIRVPAHAIARALLGASAVPIAAPSANRSGHVSPTTPAHVADDLANCAALALILDGGACRVGLESTVIDVTGDVTGDGTGDAPLILRPGGLCLAELEQHQTPPSPDSAHGKAHGNAPRSPGMLASHYAPRAVVRLNSPKPFAGEAFVAFGGGPTAAAELQRHDGPVINLSPAGDLAEAAANLFAALRALDESGATSIAVMPIPNHGIGIAINDRLTRAAAPRPKDRRQSPPLTRTKYSQKPQQSGSS